MHERTGAPPESMSCLQWFALVTIAGAILLNAAPYIGLLTNTPNFDKHSTIAKAPPAPAARLVARAELHTKLKSITARARIQLDDASPALEGSTAAEAAPWPMNAEVLLLPHPAPKQGSAILTFTAPLPVPIRKRTRTAIARSEAPPLPTRSPKKVESRIAGSTLHQIGQASWYSLDSVTASGEKMDDVALTAAHNSLPFGTKVLIENTANGRSVVVRINDRGPFVAGRIIDLSKAAAKALEMIADGVADVRLSVIHQIANLKSRARGWIDEKALAPTIRTASINQESKPVRRNSQAAKIDSEPKAAKNKKRAVTGTPATSAPAPVAKHQPPGIKRADGRKSGFPVS